MEKPVEKVTINRPRSKQPIPPHAKRVFKGVIFEVYQWQQKMYDGSYQTFEKLKRNDSSAIIPVTVDNKIVVTHQKQPGRQPYWGIAVGRIEKDEQVLEAAQRELLEETGYRAKSFHLWHAFYPSTKFDWVVYTFIAKGCIKVGPPQPDQGEKITIKAVSFDQFSEMILQKNFQEIEIRNDFLEAKYVPEKMAELRKLFLG